MSQDRAKIYYIYALNLDRGGQECWCTRAYTAADALVQFDIYRNQPEAFLKLAPRLGVALKIEPREVLELESKP
jgi:hypothetical protein